MSDVEKSAAAIKPPKEGLIEVFAVSTTASDAIDTGVAAGIRFITVTCDVDAYITFTGDGTDTITDPEAAAVSGGGRTFPVWSKQYVPFQLDQNDRYYKVVAAEAGIFRAYLSSR